MERVYSKKYLHPKRLGERTDDRQVQSKRLLTDYTSLYGGATINF